MTFEYLEKTLKIINKESGIEISIVTEDNETYPTIKLVNCMVDIEDNPMTGIVEDAILTISHLPELESMYQLRDFLNSSLPDK